eukprot:403353456
MIIQQQNNNQVLDMDQSNQRKSQLVKGIQRKKLFREQPRNQYQSLDHTNIISSLDQQQISKKLFSHRKSQVILQPNAIQKFDRESRKTGRTNHHYKNEDLNILSDDQGSQIIRGTMNTDVFSESRRQQRKQNERKDTDLRQSKNKNGNSQLKNDNTNINNSTRINDLQQSIRSSRSQNVINAVQKSNLAKKHEQLENFKSSDSQKQKYNNHESSSNNQERIKLQTDIKFEDYESFQKEDRLISPALRAKLNMKNVKSDIKQVQNKVQKSFRNDIDDQVEESPAAISHTFQKRKISNFNVKKVHMSELASPVNLKSGAMSARPKGLISGEIKIQKKYPKQDSDHERSGDDTKRVMRSTTSKPDSRYDLEETKNISNSKKIFSMIVQDKIIQNNLQKSSFAIKSPSGPQIQRQMGARFGQMFKLQKKNLNDEGIQGIDEGNLNVSNNQDVDTPFDSQSERNSSDVLQIEYQELKTKLDQMKSANKNANQMGSSQFEGNSNFNKSGGKREQSARGRKSNIKENSSGKRNVKNKQQKGRKNSQSSQEHQYDRREILSYDDNSFERELIEKLNEESSIHEDTDKSKSHYKRGHSQFQKGYYKSGNYKSKTSFHNHKPYQSSQLRKLSQSSEGSCSTCNMNKQSEVSQREMSQTQKRKSQQRKRQKSVINDQQSKKRKSKNKKSFNNNQNQQQQQFMNQFPMQMPLMTMLTPQFNMFGFPVPQMPTTQIMNFQNNYSYQGSQFPLFMPQQQQYFNMMQQPLVAPQQFPPQFSTTSQTDQRNPSKTPERNSEEKQKQKKKVDLNENQTSTVKPNNFYTFNQQNSQQKEGVNLNGQSNTQNNTQKHNPQYLSSGLPTQSPLITQTSQNNQDQFLLGSLLQSQNDQSQLRASHIKNNFSNQTTDSMEIQQKQQNQHPLNQNEENQKVTQQRLGSPQSNISRLDAQSTNMTGDYQSSVAPSQLAMMNFNNRRSLNIQTQIKEVNQLYLNKLKNQFQQSTNQGPSLENQTHNILSQEQLQSPQLVSRNSAGLNQAKSIPIHDEQNKERLITQEKQSYQIQPRLDSKGNQPALFRPSQVNQDLQQRNQSQPPQIKNIKLKNYDSYQNAVEPEILSSLKIDRHRSPQPSEIKLFGNQSTHEKVQSSRLHFGTIEKEEHESIQKQNHFNDNYYYNNNSAPQKKGSTESTANKAEDIQTKLKKLNAQLSIARQESNQSRQLKDIKFVELLSNDEDNNDFSPYDMGYDHQKESQIIQDKSRQSSQQPEMNRISYQPQKQIDNVRSKESKLQNSTLIVQTRKIQIPANQNSNHSRKDSKEFIQNDTTNAMKSNKGALILIDASPRSINTQNHPLNKIKQNLASPKSNIDKPFAIKSDYTGGESMRSSIYLLDDESKTIGNNQRFNHSKSIKQPPKKRPSNTSKQSGFQEEFMSTSKQNQKSILNSSNNIVTMTYDDTNHFQNSTTIQTHRLMNNSNNISYNNGVNPGKGSQSNKHSLLSKQLTLSATQSQDRRISQKPSEEIFVEIYDKTQRSQQSQVKTVDNRGKSQINYQYMDSGASDTTSNVSLADMFKQKMRQKSIPPNLEKRLTQQMQISSQQMSTIQEKTVPEPIKSSKQDKADKERTKQEILELRKKMMKSKIKEKKDNFAVEPPKDANGKSKDIPIELMQRLSKGQKVQVDSKEMVKLSHKNYENLPEIKKKKEEERKKEDYKQRQLMVKKYAEELEKKRKQLNIKKQASNSEKYNDII